jgi:cytochrome c
MADGLGFSRGTAFRSLRWRSRNKLQKAKHPAHSAGGRTVMRAIIAGCAIALSPMLIETAFAAEEVGPEAFNNNCRTCHSWKEGDNRLGPTLHGIIGRKAGTAEGFNYSNAMKSSGITWDEATLDKFITNPDSVVPNNNMKPFSGVGDADTRKKIIEFLKSK